MFWGIATRQHRGNAAAQHHRENGSINLPQMGRQDARFGVAALIQLPLAPSASAFNLSA
jgi:hypothetical protein